MKIFYGKIHLEKKFFKAWGWHIAAVVLCVSILTFVFKLWQADLSIPLSYSGDALFSGIAVKGQNDVFWFTKSNFLGAPFGFNMADYVSFESIYYLIFKLMAVFLNNYSLIFNLYFLLTFLLITIASLYVFRQFHLSYPAAVVGALLYTFLPYHFLRGQSHLFLSSYFFLPLMIMVVLWIALGQISFIESKDGKRIFHPNKKAAASCMICLFIGLSGVYYIFFSAYLVVIAGLYRLFNSGGKIKTLAILAGLMLVMFFAVLINVMPNLLHIYKNGYNSQAIFRDYAGPEVYGMKITQLVLPVTGHRLPLFSKIKEKYNKNYPLINENDTSTLGLMGTAGFFMLLLWLFRRTAEEDDDKEFFGVMNALAVLNIFAVLLGTLGGLGAVLSLVFKFLRGYNRISVFIAFFSIFGFMLFIEKLFRKKNAIYFFILVLILGVGLYDQTTRFYAPDYKGVAAAFQNDKIFVETIEAILPEGAMVFQLPYLPFPESPPIYEMHDYNHFIGYLHSKKLKWSYGAVKGRPGDLWQRNIVSLGTSDMISGLIAAGFKGLYVDTFGYPHQGKKIVSDLFRLVGPPVVVSGDKRYYFFLLRKMNISRGSS